LGFFGAGAALAGRAQVDEFGHRHAPAKPEQKKYFATVFVRR